MGEKSWRRNHGRGILEKESCRSNHEGVIWEASERHLGGIWESSGRHLGGTWEAQATWEASGSQLRSKPCVLSANMPRPTISCRRHALDLHVDGKFTAT